LLRPLLFASLVAGIAASMVSGAKAGPGQATVAHVPVYGVAQSYFGDCDFESAPGAISCHETYVIVFREADSSAGQSVAAPKVPWSIFIDDYTATFAGADAQPTFTNERTGTLLDPTVAFDKTHLSYLSVAAQVPMSDGSTFDFRATWTRTSAVSKFGNDGPLIDEQGLIRHSVDRCTTSNTNAHQKFVLANMSGTLNGAAVRSYLTFAIDFIADNHFTYIDVTHGSCG